MTIFWLWCIPEMSVSQCSATEELMITRKTPFHSQAEKPISCCPSCPVPSSRLPLYLWPPLNLLHRLSVSLEMNRRTQTKPDIF